jgi:hypothetical protein
MFHNKILRKMSVESESLATKLANWKVIAKHVAETIFRGIPKDEAIRKIVGRMAMSDAEHENMMAIASECRNTLARGVYHVVLAQNPKTKEEAAALVEEEFKLAQFESIIELELIEYATETRTGALQ